MNHIRLIPALALILVCSAGSVLAMNKGDRPMLKITSSGNWAVGTNQRCSWDWGNLDGNVEVTLWQANRQIVTLSPSIPVGQNGKGFAAVSVPAKLVPGTYEIRVKSISHPEVMARQTITLVANPDGYLHIGSGASSPTGRGVGD